METELKEAIKKTCPDSRILRVGKWDWVYFTDKPSKSIREAMKEAGGHFNGRRICWQFTNGYNSKHSKAGSKMVMLKYGAKEEE